MARPLRRWNVVPGPLQLRLSPHGDVHHPVRHADGGNQLLRIQHGCWLATNPGEDEIHGHPRRVVSDERPAPGLCEGPGPAARSTARYRDRLGTPTPTPPPSRRLHDMTTAERSSGKN